MINNRYYSKTSAIVTRGQVKIGQIVERMCHIVHCSCATTPFLGDTPLDKKVVTSAIDGVKSPTRFHVHLTAWVWVSWARCEPSLLPKI
jgi:hypothetical protein